MDGLFLFETARTLRTHEAREFRFAAFGGESSQRAVRKT
jgi:hypothetical protein